MRGRHPFGTVQRGAAEVPIRRQMNHLAPESAGRPPRIAAIARADDAISPNGNTPRLVAATFVRDASSMSSRFERAVARFQRVHREDPRTLGDERWSVRYHRRLADWVVTLDPDASEPLRLASHCQHIRRWTRPRSDYPAGRAGYKNWRRDLARFHGDEAAAILRDVGYDDEVIERVRELLLKRSLKADREVQLFEDAICLTFLENEYESFATKHDEDKLVTILQKTWKKMSSQGHAAALELAGQLSDDARRLVERAVAG